MGRYRHKVAKMGGVLKNYWENNTSNSHVTVRRGEDIRFMLESVGKKERTPASVYKKSNCKVRSGLARVSSMLEQYYEDLLDRGKYTESHMLAVLNPFYYAPLTAMILFCTEFPCSVRVRLEEGEDYELVTERQTRHRIPVFYLHAGRANEIHIELINDEGEIIKKNSIQLYTFPLPKCMEDMVEVDVKKDKSVSPMTLIFGGDTKYPYVFDEQGEIRYYLKRRPKSYGIFLLSEGHFLFLDRDICEPSFANPHSVLCQEMDFFGRVYHEYYVPEGIHHDGCEKEPGGNLIVASSSMEQWVEDSVIEIDRQTGGVVKTFCVGDVLREHPYFDYFDWAHVNTVSYNQEDNSVLICMRNLHSVIKVDWGTYELQWILCDGEFWKDTAYKDKVLKPVGDVSFFYQPHAAYFLETSPGEEKKLIIYDNHWDKRRPVKWFDGDRKSYVKIYGLDEGKGSVWQEHSYATPKSTIRSNGIVKQNRVLAMSGALKNKVQDSKGAMVEEFSHDTEKVINRYLVKSTFYRGYPFFTEFERFCQPVPKRGEYIIGIQQMPWELCHEEEIAGAFCGKEKRNAILYEDLLLIFGKDHEFGKIWLKGRKHLYGRDYHGTEQKAPSKFGEFQYFYAIPMGMLENDCYEIYLETKDGVIRTGKHFQYCKK